MIERHFLGWSDCPVRTTGGYLCELRTSGKWVDLSNDLVVIPTQRSFRRLLSLMAEDCDKQGKRLIPPLTALPGSLLQLIIPPRSNYISDPARIYLWMKVVESAERSIIEQLFPSLPAGPQLAQLAPLARELDTLHQEISLSGHSFSDVAEAVQSLHYDDSERWHLLATLQEALWATIADSHKIDPYAQALACREQPYFSKSAPTLILAGVPGLPPLLEQLLVAAGYSVQVLIAAPTDCSDLFSEFGRPLADKWEIEKVSVPSTNIAFPSHPFEQLELITSLCDPLLKQGSPESITICCPDVPTSRQLEGWLEESNIPVHSGRGQNFSQTELGRLLKCVRSYLTFHSVDSFTRLVRHPLVLSYLTTQEKERQALTCQEVLATLDEFRTRHLQQSIFSDAVASWDETFQTVHTKLVSFLKPLRGTFTLSDWSFRLSKFLKDAFSYLDDKWLQSWEEEIFLIFGCLEQLHGIRDTNYHKSDQLFLFLESLLGSQVIATDAPTHAVELIGWVELVFDDAPLTCVVSLHRRTLPEAPKPSAFLTETLRSQLGLVTYRDRLARDAYYLKLLLGRPEQVVFLALKQGVDGLPLHISPLLLKDESAIVAQRLLEFYTDHEGTPRSKGRTHSREGQQKSCFQSFFPPKEFQPFSGALSATALNCYLRCPFEFYLRHVLRLREVHDRDLEMNPLTFGTFVHGVLSSLVKSVNTSSDLAGRVKEIARSFFDERFAPEPLPALEIQYLFIEKLLLQFLDSHNKLMEDGWEIWATEWDLSGCSQYVTVLNNHFSLSGKVDRIDINSREGVFRVIDYKTSLEPVTPKSVRRSNGEWIDVQLPLYYFAVRDFLRHHRQSFNRIEVAYFSLSPRTDQPLQVAQWDIKDFEEAGSLLTHLCTQIKQGVFWPPSGRSRGADLASLLSSGL